MNTQALEVCLQVQAAHARLRRKLDDELGTLHGLSFDDFVLLRALAQAPSGLTAAELERPLGVQRSGALRQVIALEKTGLVERSADAQGRRSVRLRAPGRGLLAEATETAASICTRALQPGASAGASVEALCASPVLELR
jgi:DNA-binding MarR family transcriptional regulator